MTYHGEVKDGVIVLAGGVQLPEGTAVEVLTVPQPEAQAVDGNKGDDELDPIFRMDELATDTGIPDLATNIDHNLFGQPKLTDEE